MFTRIERLGKPALSLIITAAFTLIFSSPIFAPLLVLFFIFPFALVHTESPARQFIKLFPVFFFAVACIFFNKFFIPYWRLLILACLYFSFITAFDCVVLIQLVKKSKHPLPMVFIYTVVSRGIVCFMPLIFPFYWTLTLQLNRAANFTALFMLPLLLEGTILVLSTAVCLLALHRGTKKIILLQIIVIVTTGAASSAVIKYFNNRQDAAKNFECTFIQGGYSAKDYTLIEQYSELRLELAKRYVRHIEESPGSRLVIVPESALPIYQNREDPVIQSIQEIAVRKNQYIMTSLQLKEGKDVYNSMALVNPKGEIESVYRKRNIMPFVESDEYQKGRANITFNIDGYTIAPLICYDGVFVKNYFRDRRPDVYVVTSNDVFAEGTVLSRLLQAYSVINARTMGVSLLQVTQNGPSCYVDPRGKLRSLTEPYEQAIGLKVSLK